MEDQVMLQIFQELAWDMEQAVAAEELIITARPLLQQDLQIIMAAAEEEQDTAIKVTAAEIKVQ
jgi:hypothetical protein